MLFLIIYLEFVDLEVSSCNLCLNSDNKDKIIESTKMELDEYQKYNKLTDYELEYFTLFYFILQSC